MMETRLAAPQAGRNLKSRSVLAEMLVEKFTFQRREIKTKFGFLQDSGSFPFRMFLQGFRHPEQCFFEMSRFAVQ
jgi:hypothetical protein